MLQHEQFLSSISANSRPLQQSSPSDSMSTATPPHQISRGSPASTALVMSSNNIASVQPSSRQLTPSNGSSSNGNGTDNSSSSGGGGGGGGGSNGEGGACPPNPMIRQFACHTKSMSEGVVVSVPGISNNLATVTGINQNNMINNTIAANQQQQQQHHQQQHQQHHQQQQQQQQQQHHHQMQHNRQMSSNNNRHHLTNTLHNQSSTNNNNNNNNSNNIAGKPQIIKEHRTHHHRSVSHQNNNQQHRQSQHHQHQQQSNHHQHQHQHQHQLDVMGGGGAGAGSGQFSHHPIGSSQNFIDSRTGSSIVLSSNNIGNIHNRSASTHIILNNQSAAHHNQHHQHHQQQHHQQHQHQHQHQQQQHHNINNQATLRNDTSNQQHNFPSHVTNSIWSIDENLSKSHGKLTASGYLPHSLLYNPSITDISCDNISNTGGPAPGYYLHHALANGATVASLTATTGAGAGAGPGGLGANHQLSSSNHHHGSNAHSLSASGTTVTVKRPEFLPICDLMFNLISMIVYFCENVFGIIALIALYYHASSKYWALIGATFMFASNFMCQYLSLRWLYKMKLDECRRKREAQEELEDEEECERRYYNRMASNMRNYQCGSCTWLPDGATEVQLKFLLSIALDAIVHIFCLGFLVRYIKLVIPVSDTSRVKKEARDLCMLRMIHGFIQSAPLLLLQSYMVCSQSYATSIVNLSITSVILSLVSVCWAMASFTKYARKKYMHKFVLTWLGILSQLLWRLGTISSRVAALIIYAVYYNYWMLVVLSLHWVTMFLWLVKPGNLLRDETNMSRSKKLSLAVGAAWIYCFCYMNFEEHNSKAKMGVFYLIMFLENNLLFTVCQTLSAQVTWFKTLSILVVYLGFVFGMLFMLLYYKYFHVSVLNDGLSCSQDSINSIADQLTSAGKKIAGFKPGTLRLKSDDSLNSGRAKYGGGGGGNMSATLRTSSHPEIARSSSKPPYLTSNHQTRHVSQSGVFNCKLGNVGMKQQQQQQHKTPNSHVRRQHNP